MNLNLPRPPEGGRYSGCPHHTTHDTITVRRSLYGQPIIKDVPYIADRFERNLTLQIWDYRKYGEHGYEGAGFPYEYCTGQDVVSYSIFEQGMWEGYETVAWLDILHRGDRAKPVLDLGCQLGWYSVLAASAGYNVIAVDSDWEVLGLAVKNFVENTVGAVSIKSVTGWFDRTVSPIDPEPVRAVKIDLEGAEVHALDWLYWCFADGTIDYALIELSPVFNDSYPAIVNHLLGWGYRLFEIPQKGWEGTADYSEDPLETLIQTPPFTVASLTGILQTNVLAISPTEFKTL